MTINGMRFLVYAIVFFGNQARVLCQPLLNAEEATSSTVGTIVEYCLFSEGFCVDNESITERIRFCMIGLVFTWIRYLVLK